MGDTGNTDRFYSLYFVPMCGAILLGYILCSVWKAKKISIKFMYPGISFSAGLVLTVYLLGGFSVELMWVQIILDYLALT